MRPIFAVLSLVFIGCASAPVKRPAPVVGVDSWPSISKALAGRWLAIVDGHRIEVHYDLTSRETVLLETWMPSTGAETVSTMHLDGERLMLTHYCGQGNQPRLRLVEVHGGDYIFRQYDATDLADDEASLTMLRLAIGGDALVRTETYTRDGVPDTTTLIFDRIASEP